MAAWTVAPIGARRGSAASDVAPRKRPVSTRAGEAPRRMPLEARASQAPFGFPFVVAVHAGCDVAVVLVVSACDFGWTHHQGYFIALVACGALAVVGSGLLAAAWRHERFPDLPCAKDDAVPDDPPAEVAPLSDGARMV